MLLWFKPKIGESFMKDQISNIRTTAEAELSAISSTDKLEELRVKYLGKKGELTSVLKGMGGLSAEERPIVGALANEVREFLESAIEAKKSSLEFELMNQRIANEKIDVTMPGKRQTLGRIHPLNAVLTQLEDIFIGMGFSISEGPEVEFDYYNFEALNIPQDHPARDTQDTFYISDNIVLRTQTSPVQIRVMEQQKPPIRIIAPGRVYRSDAVDATHSPVFHQIEGLVIDKGITMADLKGTLEIFVHQLYGEKTKLRFRPHHFPFTEPSAEVDISCFSCGGSGCRICKNEGWIEILGAGMVHPEVLRRCNIDPEVYSGFAFGIGLDRVAMFKYDVDDLRLFYENDVRFLQQF